ncbi:mitochondrial import inner membrane translocase subunit Tim23-like [Physella acuta]|uniref:mitochondrial import inner membrane translocase subunit Tim23-like n=1 Tax=Physella acuta TaxID=109671 RepID=UPI0027DDC6DA|nr:mitochondrial import inner membrane translocase subunit Tim23-like [Physella acuta]
MGDKNYNPYSSSDPSMNVPVTTGPAGAIMSPYLNFNPAYIGPNADSQFIFPEGAARTRGRLELSFSQIGGSVFVGAAVGGVNGLYSGIKDVQARQLTGANRRTQLLNFVTKGGASTAQTLGVVALMYSVFGVILSWGRGVDDELNTVTAATATGLLYKSSAGWKRSLRGGGIGLGLSAVYVLFTSRDRIRGLMGK